MFARVATFEGADPGRVDEAVSVIRRQAEANEEGIPAKEFLLLVDREAGKSVAVMLFETEADMREGDMKMQALSPPIASGTGQRTDVALYEVAIRQTA